MSASTTTIDPVHARPSSWGLAAICMGMFMVTLDGVALNLALPSIRQAFDGTLAQLEWTVTAYTLPLAGLLLTSGALGDRWGARRLYITSLLAFAVTSLGCALSTSLAWLIAARVAQGIAAAGLLPMVLSLVVKNWQDRAWRVSAVNTLAIVGGIAMVIGPFGGGLLTQWLGWQSVFLINIPIGAAGILLAYRHLDEPPRRSTEIDSAGAISGTLSLTALMGGLIERNTLGWSHPVIVILLAVGVLGMAFFLWIEQRVAHPMLPLGMFRHRAFSAAVAGGFAFQFSCYGLLFMLALFVQTKWHVTPLRAGILLLPFALALIGTTLVVNPFLLRNGSRWMLLTGGWIAALGGSILLAVSTQTSWLALEAGIVLMAIGTGIYSPTLNMVATTTVAPNYSGLASGVYNTSRQIGMAVGIATLGSLVDGNLPMLIGFKVGVLLVIACMVVLLALTSRYIERDLNKR